MNHVGWLAAAVLAGCYSPTLAGPGFFCHPTDVPACPDGQICFGGRCVDVGGNSSLDGASASTDDLGGVPVNADLSSGGSPQPPAPDLSLPEGPPPDMTSSGSCLPT